MKAILIKNENFETIGFEVTANGQTIYEWGVSSFLKSNYQKEINTRDWFTDIINLIRLDEQLKMQKRFEHEFFNVCAENSLSTASGVKIKPFEDKIECLERKIENIINAIR
ncbi:MAG: hypothetical protein PHH23_01575 [Paludibacteraceae bacterium]|nr:hypothetical protein [Paludibacteraceae bacterium]